MVHVLISGSVQGIGFRQFIKYNAKKLNLKGWVKNLPASRPASQRGEQGGPDSRVEAVFAGDQADIKIMIEFSRKGPFLAEVKKVEVDEIPDQDFDSFEIIKD